MLNILVQEENDREPGDTGPCMEYLLQVHFKYFCLSFSFFVVKLFDVLASYRFVIGSIML